MFVVKTTTKSNHNLGEARCHLSQKLASRYGCRAKRSAKSSGWPVAKTARMSGSCGTWLTAPIGRNSAATTCRRKIRLKLRTIKPLADFVRTACRTTRNSPGWWRNARRKTYNYLLPSWTTSNFQ